MELKVEIGSDAYAQLRAIASKSSSTVEEAAADLIHDQLNAASLLDLWSYNGVPWATFSAQQLAERYTTAYADFPLEEDEFAWRDEDITHFASGN